MAHFNDHIWTIGKISMTSFMIPSKLQICFVSYSSREDLGRKTLSLEGIVAATDLLHFISHSFIYVVQLLLPGIHIWYLLHSHPLLLTLAGTNNSPFFHPRQNSELFPSKQ
jgi:hypothetical protein